ncbi:MAG: hypothetical protein MUF18_00055 [Fimbriiglobus sp.]|nr:hypothetical protein [Fimbriiglobus sp.]
MSVFLLVCAHSEFLYWTEGGPRGGVAYRYSVFGVTMAEGDSRQKMDDPGKLARTELCFTWAPVLLTAVTGVLVGGLVFFLWRPISTHRRHEMD